MHNTLVLSAICRPVGDKVLHCMGINRKPNEQDSRKLIEDAVERRVDVKPDHEFQELPDLKQNKIGGKQPSSFQ
jgi:hypothetical protein